MEILYSENIIFNTNTHAHCYDSDTDSDAGSNTDSNTDSDAGSNADVITTPHITIHRDVQYDTTTYSYKINGTVMDWTFYTAQKCCEAIDYSMHVGMEECDTDSYTINFPSTPATISVDVLCKSTHTDRGNEYTQIYLRLSYVGGDSINIMFSNCHNGYYAHPVRLSKNGITLFHTFI